MPDTHVLTERPTQDQVATYDAIVIGAGISGMFMLYRLRELGMTARVFEAGTNVGGTWYWNRYPGARFDSESWTYGYSFSKELMQEWDWKEHFSPQPDTLEYLNHVADKFDLRRDIQFRSTVAAAHWDDVANQWTVTLESGQQAKSRFLCTAVGILSAHTLPAIPGRDRENASHTEILTFPLLQLTKQAVLMHHDAGSLPASNSFRMVMGQPVTGLQYDPSRRIPDRLGAYRGNYLCCSSQDIFALLAKWIDGTFRKSSTVERCLRSRRCFGLLGLDTRRCGSMNCFRCVGRSLICNSCCRKEHEPKPILPATMSCCTAG
jgi:hypothetical protein